MYQNNYNSVYNPQQMFQQPKQQQVGLKGRPVSSLEEARAAAVDFDGSIFFFPDLANSKIYTKQINVDGTASLKMYEYKEIPIESNNFSNYVTKQEFDQTLLEIRESLTRLAPIPQEQSAAVGQPAPQTKEIQF